MASLKRATGDCANCEIASSFALGRFSELDLDECKGCQAKGFPERYRLLLELEERGRQVEKEIAGNVVVFTTRFSDLTGAKP